VGEESCQEIELRADPEEGVKKYEESVAHDEQVTAVSPQQELEAIGVDDGVEVKKVVRDEVTGGERKIHRSRGDDGEGSEKKRHRHTLSEPIHDDVTLSLDEVLRMRAP
jgi:hypothetical protein